MVGLVLYITKNAKKWNEETCREEAKKYKTSWEFLKGSRGAYQVAWKNGWLDDYDWFVDGHKLAGEARTKWNEETCHEKAKKYKTRREFEKGNASTYNVARKNGWLDDYDWFDASKTGKKWNEETCSEEARKYNTRSEFAKGNISAYQVASKNGWLEGYGWLKVKRENKWNEETCREEALKYKTRSEFKKGSVVTYTVARKNGWLDDYGWFEESKTGKKWNEETCREEASKYNTRKAFSDGSSGAYEVARKNGWLDDYGWFEEIKKKNGYWNEETCREEARKYKTRGEFAKASSSAYEVARKNGWIDDYTFLKDTRTDDTRTTHFVYRYVFKKDGEYAIYIGLTNDVKRRDREHIFDTTDAVAKYAKENDLPVPKCEVLEKDITAGKAAEREGYWYLFYKKQGYHMLNRGKTGSLGGFAFGKWNEETCREEAQKYNTRWGFCKGSSGAWKAAHKNGWLDDYDWFVDGNKIAAQAKTKWNEETCSEEAKKYKTRTDFKKGSKGAYAASLKNGWLDDYDWFVSSHKPSGYWNEETCHEEARKYKTRNEFRKGNASAYKAAWKNGLLDKFFPPKYLKECLINTIKTLSSYLNNE